MDEIEPKPKRNRNNALNRIHQRTWISKPENKIKQKLRLQAYYIKNKEMLSKKMKIRYQANKLKRLSQG